MTPEPKRLEATVRRLAEWPSRNTNLPAHREVADWLAEELAGYGLTARVVGYPLPPGPRVGAENAVQVIAERPGTDLADHLVGISAHFDTINWTDREGDPLGVLRPSPGANDDGSGVALALECARLLAARPRRRTLRVFLFSGEEQGLLGAKWTADEARREGWPLDALLNHDMVGNVTDDDGKTERHAVRLYSADDESRELARLMAWTQRESGDPHEARLVLRADRAGRGGDHTPFQRAGFPAVRMVEARECYARQHTPEDLPEGMDFDYLAANARMSLRTAAGLLNAAPAPVDPRVETGAYHGARLRWQGEGEFLVYRRRTTSPEWEAAERVAGNRWDGTPHRDDHEFAVGAPGGLPVRVT